jgi:integrase/recombinase XerD
MASFQHDAPATPLRQRMEEDMLMRGLGSHTRQDYIRHTFALAMSSARE